MSRMLEARLAASFFTGRRLDTNSALDALSDRELQVFRLIGQGRSTRQIAENFHLSTKTVESHREHIKQKLRIKSAPELAQRATRESQSLLPPNIFIGFGIIFIGFMPLSSRRSSDGGP